MAHQYRKFLLVQRPDRNYNVMLEIDDRTHSYQIPQTMGEKFLEKCVNDFITLVVQSGLAKARV